MKRTRPRFYYFGNWFLRTIYFGLGARVEIRGLEHVPSEGPLIVAISHSSYADPLLTGAVIPRDVVPMAKIDAFGFPVIGLIVRWYGTIPVKRRGVDIDAFKAALHVLKNGGAVYMAPEGTRSRSGVLQRGRDGAIMMSLHSGAPILPVAVWGGKPLVKNILHLRKTDLKFFVGEPVILKPPAPKPTREQIGAMTDELMIRIARMMPPELHGYYANRLLTESRYLQTLLPEKDQGTSSRLEGGWKS